MLLPRGAGLLHVDLAAVLVLLASEWLLIPLLPLLQALYLHNSL